MYNLTVFIQILSRYEFFQCDILKYLLSVLYLAINLEIDNKIWWVLLKPDLKKI